MLHLPRFGSGFLHLCLRFLFILWEVREALANHSKASPKNLPCLNGSLLPPVSLSHGFHSWTTCKALQALVADSLLSDAVL